VTSSLIVCEVAALILMVTKMVGAVAVFGIRTQHTDVSDEISEHIIMSIRLHFVLNMTKAGSFETSSICYLSTQTRSTATIHERPVIVCHVLFIESNRMVWYRDQVVL
jgi:hypothetical protein